MSLSNLFWTFGILKISKIHKISGEYNGQGGCIIENSENSSYFQKLFLDLRIAISKIDNFKFSRTDSLEDR